MTNALVVMRMKKHPGAGFAHAAKKTDIHLARIAGSIRIRMTAENSTISCQGFLGLSLSPTGRHVFKK